MMECRVTEALIGDLFKNIETTEDTAELKHLIGISSAMYA